MVEPTEIDYSVYYRRWHDESDAHFERVALAIDGWLRPAIGHVPRDAKVLDYGCGFGLLTHYLRRHFPNVIGVDASAQQVAVATGKGLPVSHVPVDGFAAWAASQADAFDVIFLFDVLEHVPTNLQISFMRQLVSTLRPGGEIFIKVPNANSLLAARWRYNDWTHTSSFTECSLDFVCIHAGLDQIESLPDDTSKPARMPWIPRWNLRRHYVKHAVRWLWRQYLRSELGADERQIRLGLNLLVRARRAPLTSRPLPLPDADESRAAGSSRFVTQS